MGPPLLKPVDSKPFLAAVVGTRSGATCFTLQARMFWLFWPGAWAYHAPKGLCGGSGLRPASHCGLRERTLGDCVSQVSTTASALLVGCRAWEMTPVWGPWVLAGEGGAGCGPAGRGVLGRAGWQISLPPAGGCGGWACGKGVDTPRKAWGTCCSLWGLVTGAGAGDTVGRAWSHSEDQLLGCPVGMER